MKLTGVNSEALSEWNHDTLLYPEWVIEKRLMWSYPFRLVCECAHSLWKFHKSEKKLYCCKHYYRTCVNNQNGGKALSRWGIFYYSTCCIFVKASIFSQTTAIS